VLQRKILLIVILLACFLVSGGYVFAQPNHEPTFMIPYNVLENGLGGKILQFVTNSEGREQVLTIPVNEILFKLVPKYDEYGRVASISLSKEPKFNYVYNDVGFSGKSKTSAFVYPIFTQAAYSKNGFYDYYNKKCDSKCLTVSIPSNFEGSYSSSIVGSFVLSTLNYSYITDIDIDKNPDILKQYKRIIVLHNEYVTKKEFDAITSHPDTLYLYPNALYAEVKSDYTTNTITLVRGHAYPDNDIRNGFNWLADNSRYEYNVSCDNWTFYTKANKTLLNCYPEYRLIHDSELLKYLQKEDPSNIPYDIGYWLRYPHQPNTIHRLLADFDVSGEHIPEWVANPAIWFLSGKITEAEFSKIMEYLYEIKAFQ